MVSSERMFDFVGAFRRFGVVKTGVEVLFLDLLQFDSHKEVGELLKTHERVGEI